MTATSKLPGLQLSFRDAAFDPNASERYCLVLQIDRERLTLAVLDNIANDFLAFESWHFKKAASDAQMAEQIERLCSDHAWLTIGANAQGRPRGVFYPAKKKETASQ